MITVAEVFVHAHCMGVEKVLHKRWEWLHATVFSTGDMATWKEKILLSSCLVSLLFCFAHGKITALFCLSQELDLTLIFPAVF